MKRFSENEVTSKVVAIVWGMKFMLPKPEVNQVSFKRRNVVRLRNCFFFDTAG